MDPADNFGYEPMDTIKFRKRTGRLSAFIMGLIAGIIHGILGIVVFVFILKLPTTGDFILSTYEIVIIAIILLNLIGGCIVRKSRIAGGILMITTSLLIIVISWGFLFFTAGISFIFVLTGQLSLAASILAFIPYRDRYIQKYKERMQRQYEARQQHQPPTPEPKDQNPSK